MLRDLRISTLPIVRGCEADWHSGPVILASVRLGDPPQEQFFAAFGEAPQASLARIASELPGVFGALDHSEQQSTLRFREADPVH